MPPHGHIIGEGTAPANVFVWRWKYKAGCAHLAVSAVVREARLVGQRQIVQQGAQEARCFTAGGGAVIEGQRQRHHLVGFHPPITGVSW